MPRKLRSKRRRREYKASKKENVGVFHRSIEKKQEEEALNQNNYLNVIPSTNSKPFFIFIQGIYEFKKEGKKWLTKTNSKSNIS